MKVFTFKRKSAYLAYIGSCSEDYVHKHGFIKTEGWYVMVELGALLENKNV